MPSTKIVCTLGPASNSIDIIDQLLEAGMSAARLNFSHGTHADHAKTIANIRRISRKRQRFLPILADLQGPKIRTGKLVDGNPVELELKDDIKLMTLEKSYSMWSEVYTQEKVAEIVSGDQAGPTLHAQTA